MTFRADRSNLFIRVIVAVVGIPLILFVCYEGGVLFLLFVSLLSVLGLREFYALASAKGASPQRGVGVAGALLINLAFFHEQLSRFVVPLFVDRGEAISVMTKLQLLLTVTACIVALSLLVELFRNRGSALLNLGTTFLGIFYVGFFLGTLIGIRELYAAEFPRWLLVRHVPDTIVDNAAAQALTYRWGGLTLIAILATIWMCDTAAYFGGLSMGRHKLFERVSPKKTWEGAIWGFAAAVGTMLAARALILPYLEVHQAVVIGIVIGVLGQLGDLVESLMKRDAGVKDSSLDPRTAWRISWIITSVIVPGP